MPRPYRGPGTSHPYRIDLMRPIGFPITHRGIVVAAIGSSIGQIDGKQLLLANDLQA